MLNQLAEPAELEDNFSPDLLLYETDTECSGLGFLWRDGKHVALT